MSNFQCEICGAICVDTPKGYITGCEHHPADTECKYLTCGWMCGHLFINSGLEKECNWSAYKKCIMRLDLPYDKYYRHLDK